MRRFILIGLMAATAVPVAVTAQVSQRDRQELRQDRRELRQEQRQLDRAYRSGDPQRIRQERRDVREARQDLRQTRRDAIRDQNRYYGRNDWRAYRDRNAYLYRNNGFRTDYRYRSFRPGLRIGSGYYAPRYVISDPWRYRLPRPGYNQRWVRHYNDVLLVDTRRGFVVNVIRGFYR